MPYVHPVEMREHATFDWSHVPPKRTGNINRLFTFLSLIFVSVQFMTRTVPEELTYFRRLSSNKYVWIPAPRVPNNA